MKEDEQRQKIIQLLDDLHWTHFVIFMLNKEDGNILTIRRGKDGGIIHPLTEGENLQAIVGGLKAYFKKDPDALMLFFKIVHHTINELKKEKGWMVPPQGQEGKA